MSALLDQDEIERITGYVRPSAQCRKLAELGIPHHRNARGEVVVFTAATATRASIQQAEGGAKWNNVK